MTVSEDVAWLRVGHESSVGAVRRAAVTLARQLALSERRAAEIGIAVTEMATNQVKHAAGGAMLLRACRSGGEAGVEVVAMDSGPGMSDIRSSIVDGHSTAGTLGIGLGAIARLSTAWDVFTAPGRGTVLSASFGASGTVGDGPCAAALTRPMTGEEVCGDAYALRSGEGELTAMLVDGLGHGPLAARAAEAAVRAFEGATAVPPVELVRAVHTGLQGTRGAAVAVVRVVRGRATLCGVGNIGALAVTAGSRQGMISQPGIAGVKVRTFREVSYDLPPGAVVVLYSDGVTDRLAFTDGPALLNRSPLVIAATALRDFGVRNDDAAVLVVSGAGP